MKVFAVLVFIVLMLCFACFCLWRVFSLARRAKPKTGKTEASRGMTPGMDYDIDTGEVYEEARRWKHHSRSLEEWEASLIPLWHGSVDIEFTYESDSGKTRRKVTLEDVLRTERGNIYLRGFCHVRNETRTFSRDSIATMLMVKGKRYEVEDFVIDVLGVTTKQLGWE